MGKAMEKNLENRNNLITIFRLFTAVFFLMALLVLSSQKVFAKVDTVYVPSDILKLKVILMY
jgi:hypothetical protein